MIPNPPLRIGTAVRTMGAWVSTPEYPVLKLWTFFLKKRGINYNEQALLVLLMWCESHKLDVSEGTSLDLLNWERTNKNRLAATSDGDDTVINVIKP